PGPRGLAAARRASRGGRARGLAAGGAAGRALIAVDGLASPLAPEVSTATLRSHGDELARDNACREPGPHLPWAHGRGLAGWSRVRSLGWSGAVRGLGPACSRWHW